MTTERNPSSTARQLHISLSALEGRRQLFRVTVLEVIKRGAEFLQKRGVESPRLQSELLLAHVLQIQRLKLYLDFERKLTAAEMDRARELVKRRAAGEPLQYIIGSACFCGHEIKVGPAVLIPRPETEVLAEKAGNHLEGCPQPRAALDLATGSGCIAVAFAARINDAAIVASDISSEALEMASGNAKQNGVANRVRFVQSNGFQNLAGEGPFDVIVSNPPYIPSGDIQGLAVEVKDFEPRAALDGGVDGLNFYRLLAGKARAFLKERGKLFLEFGDGQESVLPGLFEEHGWIVEEVARDNAGKPRILIAARNKA